MDQLDRSLKQHYESQQLDPKKMDRILRQGRPRRRWAGYLGLAVAACLAFAVAHQQLQRRATVESLLAEIAMNHAKGLAVEVAGADYSQVQAGLERLDFPLQPAPRLQDEYALLGGRYCSIQGGLAAQLKVRQRATGLVRTLYVTRLTPQLEGLLPLDGRHEGVPIRLWAEEGRVFALAGE